MNGGYQLLYEKKLPPLYFSEQEAAVIFFVAESLRYYNNLPFAAEIESALNKFYHYLPSDNKKRIDQLRSSVMLWIPIRKLETPFLSALLDAILEQKIVTIIYESEKGISERDIQSIGAYTMNGFWYCPSYCFKSQDYRTFRVDRVLSLVYANDQSQQLDFSQHHIQDWVSNHTNQVPENEKGVNILVIKPKVLLSARPTPWCT